MAHPRSAIVLSLGLALACTEPNPYAQETGEESTAGESDDAPDCGDPACRLGLGFIEFSLQGDEKDECGTLETGPLAGCFFVDTVERYEPGGNAVFEFTRNADVDESPGSSTA